RRVGRVGDERPCRNGSVCRGLPFGGGRDFWFLGLPFVFFLLFTARQDHRTTGFQSRWSHSGFFPVRARWLGFGIGGVRGFNNRPGARLGRGRNRASPGQRGTED